MAIEKFDMKALTTIDGGRIQEAFHQELKRCESDCKDRPAAGKARVVTLSAKMTPVCSASGELESVDVTFQIKSSVPTRESATYNMKSVAGGLLFNDMSPEDIDQLTIDEPQPRSTMPTESETEGAQNAG